MNEWINVKDRLPEHCIDVLVYNGMAIFMDFYDRDFKEWYHQMSRNDYIPPVTHWMPLPKKPY